MPEILKSDTTYGIYVLTLTPRTQEDKVLTFKFEVKKKSIFVLVCLSKEVEFPHILSDAAYKTLSSHCFISN